MTRSILIILIISLNYFSNCTVNLTPSLKKLYSYLLPTFDLIILHNNDIHGRFDQTDINGNTCTKELAESNKCYGGIARTANLIQNFRKFNTIKEAPAVLYFFTGDIYYGTVWFSLFKDKISSDFLNILQPDAITLGNRDFDLGADGIVPYLNDVKSPIVVSNVDLIDIPVLQNILVKSTILTVKKHKIGILGCLTRTTLKSKIGKLVITDEIDAINQESKKLKDMGIDIIIVLGHSGYKIEKEIAKNCPLIDLVIGAHSHTYLSSKNISNSGIIETVKGPYPTIIQQESGKLVPVVQAYAFTKYLGAFKVKFDYFGNLLSWKGEPILLDYKIPQDEKVNKLLQSYTPEVDSLKKRKLINEVNYFPLYNQNLIRTSEVVSKLYGKSIVNCAAKIEQNVCITIFPRRAIIGAIDSQPFDYTYHDVMLASLMNFTIGIKSLKGQQLIDSIRLSLKQNHPKKLLFFDGIQIKKNEATGMEFKIIENCTVKKYKILNPENQYRVVMPLFAFENDGYDWVETKMNGDILSCTDYDAIVEFLKTNKIRNNNLNNDSLESI